MIEHVKKYIHPHWMLRFVITCSDYTFIVVIQCSFTCFTCCFFTVIKLQTTIMLWSSAIPCYTTHWSHGTWAELSLSAHLHVCLPLSMWALCWLAAYLLRWCPNLFACALSLWNLCLLVRKETEGLDDIHTSIVQILSVPVSCLCYWISCLDTNVFLGALAEKQLRNCKVVPSNPKIHKLGVLSANTPCFDDNKGCWHCGGSKKALQCEWSSCCWSGREIIDSAFIRSILLLVTTAKCRLIDFSPC